MRKSNDQARVPRRLFAISLPTTTALAALGRQRHDGGYELATDCDGEAPRRERAPLGSQPDPVTLKRWLRRWTNVRHREAAERTAVTSSSLKLAPIRNTTAARTAPYPSPIDTRASTD